MRKSWVEFNYESYEYSQNRPNEVLRKNQIIEHTENEIIGTILE